MFNVVDDFNREALSIKTDQNMPAQRVVRALDRFAANRLRVRSMNALAGHIVQKHWICTCSERWRHEYNNERQFVSLNNLTPEECLLKTEKPEF